ncbi:unnamed protein product, partial [Nesidiocoris tenuis]
MVRARHRLVSRTWRSASAEYPAYGPEVRPATVHGIIVPSRIVISPQFCRLTPGQSFSERSDPVLARIREAKSLLDAQEAVSPVELKTSFSQKTRLTRFCRFTVVLFYNKSLCCEARIYYIKFPSVSYEASFSRAEGYNVCKQ